MPIRFPVSEFFETSGNTAAVFTEQLRDGIAGFACSIWNRFPDFVTEGTNPVSSFSRGFMNQACSAVQPPVPPPTPPFTGGQCVALYNMQASYDYIPGGGGSSISRTEIIKTNITGAITEVETTVTGNMDAFNFVLTIQSGTDTTTASTTPAGVQSVIEESLQIVFLKSDGSPDECGDPPPNYRSPEPIADDLTDTIDIPNLDGTVNSYEITYNKITSNYNFPFGFKVNGVNVTLDLGGISIYAPDGIGNLTGGEEVPPPGSDGGNDGVGGEITKIYPESEYMVAPEIPVPRIIKETVQSVVCNDGVLDTVSTVVKGVAGANIGTQLLLGLLNAILTEICESEDAVLGLPEYYSLRVAVERPAIVYLYKEYINGTWQQGTYSSTVSNPSAAAVAAIDTVVVPDKTIGTLRRAITLTDGSRIQATGETEIDVSATFSFLLGQVNPVFLPADIPGATTEGKDNRLIIKTLKCRKIEYYPNGKKDNVAPAQERYLTPD